MVFGMLLIPSLPLLIAVTLSCAAAGFDPKELDRVLQQGVADRVYPGAVAFAGDADGVFYQNAVGMHKYPADVASGAESDNRPMTLDTWFDLASVSKVVATTSAVALLYQEGHLSLEDRIVSLLPLPGEMEDAGGAEARSFATNGKAGVTVRNCLLHNSGLSPDPLPYW